MKYHKPNDSGKPEFPFDAEHEKIIIFAYALYLTGK